MIGAEDGLQLLRTDFRRRRLFLGGMLLLPVFLALLFLLTPGYANTLTWPLAVVWTVPLALLLMVALALRLDSRRLQFVIALQSRILASRYYARDLGVVLVFDNNLVLQRSIDLRFHLFFDSSGEVLPPMPEKVYAWFYHATRMRGEASVLGGEGSIPSDLQRIRDATGAHYARLILSERPKPLEGWPEVRYCNSLWLRMPVGTLSAAKILAEVDDLVRFLSDSESTMNHAPWPPPGARRRRRG